MYRNWASDPEVTKYLTWPAHSGVDVSKASSEVAILVNSEKVMGYTITNDAIGLSRLLEDLASVHKPEVIFEATGVYSRRLQGFLEENGYAYTRLNPLEAKKQLDSLRVRKTDKIDAEKLAQSQFVINRKPSYVQEEVYQKLRDLSRFYQNLTEDIVRTKNRLHKVLQVTFPELRLFYLLQLETNIGLLSQTSQHLTLFSTAVKQSWLIRFANQP